MVATTLSAVVRVVDLPAGTTVTGAELFEVVQTTGGVGQSVQLSLNQIVTSVVGALPTGGGTGQILNKTNSNNFSSTWSNITQFVAVGTSLATTGSATSIVAFVANQGISSAQILNNTITSAQIATNTITSTQIANNAVGTNQLASSIGIASSVSIGTLLTVTGTATFNGGIVGNGSLGIIGSTILTGTLVAGNTLINGTFGVIGSTVLLGTFGVTGTASFTSSDFNVTGTTNITGIFGVAGTTIFTSGTFGVVGTTLFTSTFGVVGTTLYTGAFGIVGTTNVTGAFGIAGTTLVTGVLGVVGTSLLTGALVLGNFTTGLVWSSGTGVISATTNIATGLVVTVFNIGNATTGTVTPSPLNGNYQYLTNNGAFTIAAYTTFDFALDVLIQNGTAPGNVGFSGFRISSTNVGDALSSTARLIASAVIATGSPGIVTCTAHLSNVSDPVWFSTSGALPTGMTSGTLYYISTTTANTLQIATTPGTTVSINLSGTQSGTHTSTYPSQYIAALRSMHFVPTYIVKALQ